jgi:hypothetical protein
VACGGDHEEPGVGAVGGQPFEFSAFTPHPPSIAAATAPR